MEEKQPWITCYLTDMLLSYVRETLHREPQIDYPALFQGIEGFETPTNPASFLADVSNWIPISVLRQLELQCERISGRKDIAYHAAKDYFTPGRRQLPSLFEVILQVLHDVRSALIFANLWAVSQTNYLKLQSFEKHGHDGGLYVLLQFEENARPTISAINLTKGFGEGFPRLYPFIEEVKCIEEISQLRLEDITREFPQYFMTSGGDSISIQLRSSEETIVRANRVLLKSETVSLSPEFMQLSPEAAVVLPHKGQIKVLTRELESNAQRTESTDSSACLITTPGVLSHGPLTYDFQKGQIFDAPYSRFRFLVREGTVPEKEIPVETLRKQVSKLLFEHLRQAKHVHTRMAQMSDEKRWLTVENIRLRREVEREYSFAGIVGPSERMQELFALVRSAAETDVTVLIQGETGTGKELIARAIHYNSPRKAKRFVAINCGALSETLLESELFGHEKGAFTGATTQRKGIFEVADGGTLFLDEIGEISISTQVKLLRVLQEGELQRVGGSHTIKVDVRIVAATNQTLTDLVTKGRVRQDLFYRLNVFPLTVPPLRERIEDIPFLVNHLIEKGKQKLRKEISGVSPQAMALLMAYNWPGNVRELENAIQRMTVIAKGETLDVENLPAETRGKSWEANVQPRDLKKVTKESAEIIEKRTIMDALSKTGGNVTHAAKALGISRATLQNKMKLYGLRSEA
jgi:transcriptional regulator with PAS, ATPase and Fis domain